MQKKTQHHARGDVLVLSLLVMLVGVLYLYLHRAVVPKVPAANVTRGENTAKPAPYQNRAIWRGLMLPAEAQAPSGPAISGHIYDTDGHVLSGAVVSATTYELAGNLPSLAGTARSGPDGSFRLQLAEGTYQVNAAYEGYGPASTTARTGTVVSLVLPRSGAVTGHVFDEQRRPVPRFVIDVVSVIPGNMPAPAPLWSKAFNSADGSFRADQLPGWSVIIKATAPGYASAFSEPMLVGPKQARQVDLVMSAGCALQGTVQDASGASLAYVLVDAEARIVAGAVSSLSAETTNQVQSDAEGRFRLDHVPLGAVRVRAYDGGHAVTVVTVQLDKCNQTGPIKLVLTTGGSVAGTARTSDGLSDPDAVLALSNRAIGIVTQHSDAQGRFRFDRLPPGMARLELDQGGQRTLVIAEIKDGQVVEHDISAFSPGTGEIHGRVTAGGRPLPGARVLIASGHGKSGVDSYYTITGEDGTFEVRSLPAGPYLVNVISTPQGSSVAVRPGGVETVNLDTAQQMDPTPPDDQSG